MQYLPSGSVESDAFLNTRALNNDTNHSRRGYSVYNAYQTMGISGYDSRGNMITGEYEVPSFYLSIDQRIEIFRKCDPVFGVVTSRMNRMSALDWEVVPDSDSAEEDKIAIDIKSKKQIFDEYSKSTDLKYVVASKMVAKEIMAQIPEVLPDLSNFDRAMFRWSKKIKILKTDVARQAKDWLSHPNNEDYWEDLIKKYIFDLLIHGFASFYKESNGEVIDNLYVLPGGTMYPLHSRFIGGYQAYVQVVTGYSPLIYFQDEVVVGRYVPSSNTDYGFIPLEALINKVAESLLFDQLMAEQADGTKPPQKLLVFGDYSPFANMLGEFKVGMNSDEQKRIETKVNLARKEAVATITGKGQPMVLDLSRENTMNVQMQRQDQVRQAVAMVYNMSNLEINQSSSEGVSGRSTSESLETIDQNKGILPLVKILENNINHEVLPFRFGFGYKLQFQVAKDPTEELQYSALKVSSGLYSVNEVRVNDLGEDPFDDPQYDKPNGAQPTQDDGMGMGMDESDDQMGGIGDLASMMGQ